LGAPGFNRNGRSLLVDINLFDVIETFLTMPLEEELLASPVEGPSTWADVFVEPQQSLAALLCSSVIGVAICDRQFRFRAINEALAAMNGLPAESHIGKTLQQIMGDASHRIEPAIQHVLATGRPLCNLEVTAKLPTKPEVGHWIENFYPIKDASGLVLKVGVIVLEITKNKSIEQALCRLTWKLHQVAESLETDGAISRRANRRATDASRAMLEHCILETRMISEMLESTLGMTALQRHQFVSPVEPGEETLALRSTSDKVDRPADCMSRRERQVFEFLAQGKSNKQIASLMNISIRTVETHRAKLMLKLDLHSVVELVRYAVRNQIV
jgi:PAS domain S-box-containing protein